MARELEIRIKKVTQEIMDIELLVVRDHSEEVVECRQCHPEFLGMHVQELFDFTDNFTITGV
jgi:hypothetical protein